MRLGGFGQVQEATWFGRNVSGREEVGPGGFVLDPPEPTAILRKGVLVVTSVWHAVGWVTEGGGGISVAAGYGEAL